MLTKKIFKFIINIHIKNIKNDISFLKQKGYMHMSPLDKIWIRIWVEKYFADNDKYLPEDIETEERINKILSEIVYSMNLLLGTWITEDGYSICANGEKGMLRLSENTWECIYKIYVYIKQQSNKKDYSKIIEEYALNIKKEKWDELPEELYKLVKVIIDSKKMQSELFAIAVPLRYWVGRCFYDRPYSNKTKKQEKLINEEIKNIAECINCIFDAELNEEGAVLEEKEKREIRLKKNTWDNVYFIYLYMKNHSKEQKEHIKRINKKQWERLPEELSKPVREILNDEEMLSEILICKKPLRMWLKRYIDETDPRVIKNAKSKTDKVKISEKKEIKKYSELDSSEQRDYRRVELKKITLRLNCIFDTELDEYGRFEEENSGKTELKISKKTWDSILSIYENTERYTENEKDLFVLLKKKQWERLPENIIKSINRVLNDNEKMSELQKAVKQSEEDISLDYGNWNDEISKDIDVLMKERYVDKINDIIDKLKYLNEVKAYIEERIPKEKSLIPKNIDIKSKKELTEYALKRIKEMDSELSEEEAQEEAQKRVKRFMNMQNLSCNLEFMYQEIYKFLDKFYENLADVSENLENFISSNIDEETAEEFADFAADDLIADDY